MGFKYTYKDKSTTVHSAKMEAQIREAIEESLRILGGKLRALGGAIIELKVSHDTESPKTAPQKRPR